MGTCGLWVAEVNFSLGRSLSYSQGLCNSRTVKLDKMLSTLRDYNYWKSPLYLDPNSYIGYK